MPIHPQLRGIETIKTKLEFMTELDLKYHSPNDAKPVLSAVFLHQKIERLIPFISEEPIFPAPIKPITLFIFHLFYYYRVLFDGNIRF